VSVEDLDERVESISARGIEPASRETYENGVRNVIYRDPDGNEIGFGGDPEGRVVSDAYSAARRSLDGGYLLWPWPAWWCRPRCPHIGR
jgi:hypothetical protein